MAPVSRPRVLQDPRQLAALAAALIIGAQLVLGYWFYSYVIWFYPLLIIAVIHAPREHPAVEERAPRLLEEGLAAKRQYAPNQKTSRTCPPNTTTNDHVVPLG